MNAPFAPTHDPGTYRLKVNDYLTLAEAGAFGDQRTEFLEGEIIVLSPQYRPHLMVKMCLYDAINDVLRETQPNLRTVVKGSVSLDERSMPDPDISVTTEPNGAGAIPVASVILAVEVADTTLQTDLHRKADLYSNAAIPEYWVADVQGRVLHQMWTPTPDGYADRRRLAFGDRLTAVTIAELSIDTAAF